MDFKYCPVCGQANLNQLQPKLITCEECHFEWYQNPAAAANVLLYNDNFELLLGRRAFAPNKGKWGTIGGFVDPHETLEEAVVREAKEELGVSLDPAKLKYFTSKHDTYEYKSKKSNTLGSLFIYKITSEEIKDISPADDVSEVGFFKSGEIPWSELSFESTKDSIKLFVDVFLPDTNSIQSMRNCIDYQDLQLLQSLAHRQEIVVWVGKFKKLEKISIKQPQRFYELVARLRKEGKKLGLSPELIEGIWHEIHRDSLKREV